MVTALAVIGALTLLVAAVVGAIVIDDARMARKAFVQPRPFDLS